jgi:hypothetical protein
VRVDLADEIPALGLVVLDERDRAREGAPVAVEQALGEGLVRGHEPTIMPAGRGGFGRGAALRRIEALRRTF